jgi:LuxR family transcriptional regulator, maltose regulon positive regulatory protein
MSPRCRLRRLVDVQTRAWEPWAPRWGGVGAGPTHHGAVRSLTVSGIDEGPATTGRVVSPVAGPGQSLLEAKVSVPQPRPGAVSRKKLVDTARSSDCRVVGITAPAGYGKSTFLAEWASVEDRRVAWVSLDRFDDDPATLLAQFATAYFYAGLGSLDLVTGMTGRGVSVLSRAAPRLASALHASPVPFAFFLDDLHELRSPACHDALDVLIPAIPRGSQLATASRCEQPHLARLRASGDALEFGPGDLALDAAGAQHIFSVAQVSLAPELAAAVTERTEGWAAGLHLAALIAKDSRAEALAITGDDRYVADYLYRETLTRQPQDTQRFLRRTAVLDQFCAPLCEAVTKSPAAAHLRHLEARGLFLIPLDRRREWYRYHALFREFLLGELRHTEPDLIPALHQRAADWYEANGSPALAVEHLLHTTDWDRTVRLVTQLTLPTYMAGQLPTVLRWHRAIGGAHIERYPPLAVMVCWISTLSGDMTGALRWAEVVNAASFAGPPGDGSASFDSARAMLQAAMCATGSEQMLADASFAVAHEAPWSPWRDTALWALAEAHLLAGHLDQARAAFAEASTTAAPRGNFDNVTVCEANLAWLAMDRGDWLEAGERLQLALTAIEDNRLHDYVASIPAFAAAAQLSLHQGDLKETHRHLARAMRARPSATYLLPYQSVRLRLYLAKVYLALADPGTARQLLREIDDVLTHRPALGTLVNEVGEFRRTLASSTVSGAAGRPSLTPAELRLLPYLQTHLTARGIAERLFISSHTARTQVKSIYRKLGVSSRSDAVQEATKLGLLGA